MKTLNLDLGIRSYPIHIHTGLLNQAPLLTEHIKNRSVMIVTNETVGPLYLAKVTEILAKSTEQIAVTTLPDGEQYKNLETLNQIFTTMLENRYGRDACLIALGGGVVGDMCGFAAAAYQRGVDFIQIPTTLLAQVDSSVGGKTGVNHELGKNMIGAFHQPKCVIIDTDTLDTLDDRQLSAGIAEIIKYGIITDIEFFKWLEDNMQALLQRDKEALSYAIHRSCEIKAHIVAADEHEKGQRALLNLGHTFGHAIETASGYGNWLHGEAVGTGMVMAAQMSQQLSWIDSADIERIQTLIAKAKLPIKPPSGMTAKRFMELMAVDKKVIHGQLRLVLIEKIGKSIVTGDFPSEALQTTLHKALQ